MSKHFLRSLHRSLFQSSGKAKQRRRRHGHQRTLAMESLESRQMLSVTPLQDLTVSKSTGEKPQSKVFEHAGQWWTVMPNKTGTWIFRLDGTSWTPTQQITTNKKVRADVKLVDDLAHVLLYNGTKSQLATLQYDAGPDNRFEPWSLQPQLVNVPLSKGVQTATIDVDSTGRMWVGYDVKSTVEVRYSDGLYTSWSAPITVASGIKSHDMSAIIAMPNNSIGVMWSNQNTKRFGFSVHEDGAAPTQWSAIETPALQWVTTVGGKLADDHINLAVTSDGTVYAAIKTGYDSSSRPEIVLLVRRPDGTWDELYEVDRGTRPIVVVNEAAGKLIVAYSSKTGGGDILYRESPLGNIALGPRMTLMTGSKNNNVTSAKATSSSEIVFLAGARKMASGALFSFDTAAPVIVDQAGGGGAQSLISEMNLPPMVDAGPNLTGPRNQLIHLTGVVADDGKPGDLTLLSILWSKVSGPGTVAFGDETSAITTAQFSTAGSYVLRLTASDGELSALDELTVSVS